MGTWGPKTFQNDTSADWGYLLEGYTDLSLIENTIDKVFKKKYINWVVGVEALAAIDTLARLKGNYDVKTPMSEDVDIWVSKYAMDPPRELVEKALKALKLIMGESSQLRESWVEAESFIVSPYEEWKTEVMALGRRLIE